LAKGKKVSPEQARQAAAMKARLEQLQQQRTDQDRAATKGANAGGGWAHGVDAKQIRSGRRGNR
jgi:hypothetical protein